MILALMYEEILIIQQINTSIGCHGEQWSWLDLAFIKYPTDVLGSYHII